MLARIAHAGSELERWVGKRDRIDQSMELEEDCRRQRVKGHFPSWCKRALDQFDSRFRRAVRLTLHLRSLTLGSRRRNAKRE
jgi:hypothetical protein